MDGIKRNILLNPGPGTTTDSVKMAMVVPDICPREEEFVEIVQAIRTDLVRIAGGNRDFTAVLFSGSGTAVMDAVINSVVPPKRKLAVIVNGAYGERMVQIAEAYGIPCVEIGFAPGTRIDVEQVRKRLDDDKEISCLAVVHHETTSGILNPVKKIGEICKSSGRVFIVDAISSYAGISLNIRQCGIDFMLSTSNKCIQGMAGIGFVIAEKAALEQIKEYPKRSFYLDLYSQFSGLEKTGQFQFTPPVQVVYALRQAIRDFFAEGAEERQKRYAENYAELKAGLREIGFRFLLRDEDESGILITVVEPDDERYHFGRMHDYLFKTGFTIYPGKLSKSRTFRLAVMGDIYPDDIKEFLSRLKEFIRAEGLLIKYREGE
jgi:2-aminoethylphosphonate aminotransferase